MELALPASWPALPLTVYAGSGPYALAARVGQIDARLSTSFHDDPKTYDPMGVIDDFIQGVRVPLASRPVTSVYRRHGFRSRLKRLRRNLVSGQHAVNHGNLLSQFTVAQGVGLF